MTKLIEFLLALLSKPQKQPPPYTPAEAPVDLQTPVPLSKAPDGVSDRPDPAEIEPEEDESMQSYIDVVLTLKRGLHEDSSGQVGELFHKGRLLCHICEDPSRPGEPKIYGKTAVPAGRYQVEMATTHGRAAKYEDRWAWHDHEIFHLLDVEGFTLIQIHPGNTPEDTLGCLLPGTWNNRTVRVNASVTAYKKLYRQFAKAARNGYLFIEIEDKVSS